MSTRSIAHGSNSRGRVLGLTQPGSNTSALTFTSAPQHPVPLPWSAPARCPSRRDFWGIFLTSKCSGRRLCHWKEHHTSPASSGFTWCPCCQVPWQLRRLTSEQVGSPYGRPPVGCCYYCQILSPWSFLQGVQIGGCRIWEISKWQFSESRPGKALTFSIACSWMCLPPPFARGPCGYVRDPWDIRLGRRDKSLQKAGCESEDMTDEVSCVRIKWFLKIGSF